MTARFFADTNVAIHALDIAEPKRPPPLTLLAPRLSLRLDVDEIIS